MKSGAINGYTSFIGFNPTKQIGLVVLCRFVMRRILINRSYKSLFIYGFELNWICAIFSFYSFFFSTLLVPVLSSLEEYVNVTFSLYLIEDGLAMQISSACRVCVKTVSHLRFLRLNQTTLRFLQISSVCFENFMNFFYS